LPIKREERNAYRIFLRGLLRQVSQGRPRKGKDDNIQKVFIEAVWKEVNRNTVESCRIAELGAGGLYALCPWILC